MEKETKCENCGMYVYYTIRIEDAKKGKLSKEDLRCGLLVYLKLLHPFVPFVTEAVWKELENGSLLITSAWPSISNAKRFRNPTLY
mgnify:CR=1 FL=1